MNILKKYFLPTDYKKSFKNVTPEYLKQHNIEYVITDLDNTLVGFDEKEANDDVLQWMQSLTQANIKIMIVSNGSKQRVSEFSDPHEIMHIYEAKKPLARSFIRAMNDMNAKPHNTIVIGDQLLTDVLCANRIGLKSVLVLPIKSSDGFQTLINRKIERRIMKYFKKNGMLDWSEKNE